MTHGLGPAGYDLRLDLGEEWLSREWRAEERESRYLAPGQFILAAGMEYLRMPDNVLGRVCDKSTLARRGLAAQNTVVEPGWEGFLTLELTNHSRFGIGLRQGQPIVQIIFEFLDEPAERPYPADGKYQRQEAGPQAAR